MVLFEMKNIKKSFGSLEVLKDISLQVEEGEVLSIIGPSGSGKSTLLRCATGLETPDSGEIIKQGDVGLVFQNFNLFPHFSVLKNITDAPIRVQKRKKEEVYAQARTLLKQMGLADRENAYPFQLSGGQQQRAAIARSLIYRPALLLAGYSFACCFGACCPPAGAEAGTGAFPGRMECQGIPSIVEISTLPDSTKPLMSVSRASAF